MNKPKKESINLAIVRTRKESERRFRGKLGEEYNLFSIACPHYEELQKRLAQEIREYGGVSALEIGCCPGYTTHFVLQENPAINITAVDNEEVMIKQARVLLKEDISEGRVTLVHQDALAFLRECPDESFEVVFSAFTLHNFKSQYRSRVLNEIYRVLRHDGLFVNADKYAVDDERRHTKDFKWQVEMFDVYDKIGKPELKKEWIVHYEIDDKPDLKMNERESIEYMRNFGFNVTSIFRKRLEAIISARK